MTILVAATRPTVRAVQGIFGKNAKLVPAIRMADALKIVGAGVDLILCSVQFDESRMFEFLTVVKSNRRSRAIPFICFRHLESALRPASFRGLEVACKAYGAEFIDLAGLRAQYGMDEAQGRFREMVFPHVGDNSAVG